MPSGRYAQGHRILNSALTLAKNTNGKRQVILVSKDVNLRMKAKALGIPEDYTTDRITDLEELYSGKEIIDDFDDDILQDFTSTV